MRSVQTQRRTAHRGASLSKDDAPNYRDSQGAPRCDECRHEDPPGSMQCKLFAFKFDKGHTCDAFAAPTDHERRRSLLIRQLARLQGVRKGINAGRKRLKDRAAEQSDSMPHAIDTVNAHLQRDKGGGILGFRRLRTLLTERRRLDGIVATRGPKE